MNPLIYEPLDPLVLNPTFVPLTRRGVVVRVTGGLFTNIQGGVKNDPNASHQHLRTNTQPIKMLTYAFKRKKRERDRERKRQVSLHACVIVISLAHQFVSIWIHSEKVPQTHIVQSTHPLDPRKW